MKTVNDIFRQYGEEYRKEHPSLTLHEKKVMRALELCRTKKMGGRVEVCDKCGHTVRIYHSCRNRHCPQCQFMKKEEWISNKKDEVFPFQYFHVVFTLPHKLNPIVIRNKKLVYDLLFRISKETLLSIAREDTYMGANIGFFSILHTWGQKLNLHPHLHCVVPGGGFSESKGKWIRSPRNYLFPVEVVKRRFRSLFLMELKKLYKEKTLFLKGSRFTLHKDFQELIDQLFEEEWVVYLKESFENSSSVIEYLARYTHRIAISNYRIVAVKNDKVSFTYKDYKDNNRKKIMVMDVMKFMSSFMLHVVPVRFVRIRYYGLMANRNKKKSLIRCRDYYEIEKRSSPSLRKWDQILLEVTGIDITKCPLCQEGNMQLCSGILENLYRPPPEITA